jgi:RND family efflux transporter MFP subunit
MLESRLLALVLAAAVPPLSGEGLAGKVLPFRQAELSVEVSGVISGLMAKEGDQVKAGQPLALLHGRLEELEMQRAKAVLDRKEYEDRGAKKLYDSKVIPEHQARDSRVEAELARLNYESAAEQVRLHTLLSPFDGVVVERCRELGEAVNPSRPLYRILDATKVYVQCALKPCQLGQAPVGRKLEVRFPSLEGVAGALGEVVFVDARADGEGCFRMKVLVENPELRIRVGIPAEVELPKAENAAAAK